MKLLGYENAKHPHGMIYLNPQHWVALYAVQEGPPDAVTAILTTTGVEYKVYRSIAELSVDIEGFGVLDGLAEQIDSL